MNVRRKLLLSLAPLALVLVALGTLSARALMRLGEEADRILRDNYRSVLAAESMKEAIERVDSAALFLVAGRRQEGLAQAEASTRRFEEQLRVQQENITEAGEAEATGELRQRWDDYRAALRRFQAAPTPDVLRERYFGELYPRFSRVKEGADRILFINQDAMMLKSERARAVSRRSTTLVVFATIGAFLVGLAATAALTTRVLRPLAVLTQAVRRIGEGDLAARAAVTGSDEIAGLAREFNAMVGRLDEYRRSSLGELLQAQQAAQATIDSLPDPVVVLGAEGAVLNVNAAAEALLRPGLTADPLGAAPPDVRYALEKVRAHVLSGRGTWVPRGYDEAIRVQTPDGLRHLLPRAAPLYSESGGVQGATIVLQDVTRLLRFDELKNDLVATVAHELRTPLTSLRMAVHLCLEQAAGPLTAKQEELLHAARQDCERLQAIVDDLLDLSRMQSGRVEVSPVAISAKTLLDAAVAEHRQAAEAAGLTLSETLVAPILPVRADTERVSLVLSNLVQNALRHAPRGSTVEVRCEPEARQVRFSVVDHGPGVPVDQRQRVFEKFVRLPDAKGEGLGLGLYISREIVLAHGGDIGVEDAPGGGSRFWFTLPVAL